MTNHKLRLLLAALVAWATLLTLACASQRADEGLDASVHPSHKVGASSPFPTGTGLQTVTSGAPNTAALAGDAGWVLTSNGPSSLPSYQAPSSTVVEGQEYQFSNTASDVGGYDSLLGHATGSESDLTAAVTSGGGQVLIQAFATAVGDPDVVLIPAGLWSFNVYRYTSLTGAFTSGLVFKVYSRTAGGSETLQFTATSANIQNTSVGLEVVTFNVPNDIAIGATDRLVVKVYAQTTSIASATIHFVFDGTTHASQFRTSIVGGSIGCGGDCTGNVDNMVIANLSAVQTVSFASGSVPSLGRTTDTYGSDADKTAASTVYNKRIISVSGTQTNRKYILPSTSGGEWLIGNGTTSRMNVITSGGTGNLIPVGTSRWCHADGTNIKCNGGFPGSGWVTNDLGATLGSSANFPIAEDEVTVAYGSNYPVQSSILTANFSDASTFITIATVTPTANSAEVWDATFFAADFNGASNTLIPNFHKCNLEFVTLVLNNGTIYYVPQSGNGSAPSTSATALVGVSCTVDTGCSSNSATTGCATGSSPTYTFQVTTSGSTTLLQAKGIDAHAYRSSTSVTRQIRLYGAN